MSIYIKELLPNPVGQDTLGEWIKLINTGGEKISLANWRISDESGKKFVLSTEELLPQGELELGFGTTRIALNNDKDKITLYNNEGSEADSLSYNGALEGQTIIAERFKKVMTKESLAVVREPALKEGVVNDSYELWPILVGVVIALTATALGAVFSKKIFTRVI